MLGKHLGRINDLGRLFINVTMSPFVAVICIVSRFSRRKYDIGIGPMPIINNVYFKRALVRKGYKVETFAENLYHITNEFDYIYTKDQHPVYARMPVLFFIRCIFRYRCIYIYFDGFVLHGEPFLCRIEHYLLKLADIKVVVMPYGSDHQSFKNAKNILMQHVVCQDYSRFFKYNQQRIEKDVERWTIAADYVLAHQECVDYLFYWDRVRWSLFGIDTDRIHPVETKKHDCIRVFHAPNHRAVKGSAALEKAIEELKNEGYNVEYVYAYGISNEEIIKIIQSCDVVVDQLVLGTYSMFSMEALACGKPVICFIRPDLKEFYEAVGAVEVDELPFVVATVLSIKQVLRDILSRPEELPQIGEKGRKFVEKYHSLEAIGEFYDEINKEIGIRVQKDNQR